MPAREMCRVACASYRDTGKLYEAVSVPSSPVALLLSLLLLLLDYQNFAWPHFTTSSPVSGAGRLVNVRPKKKVPITDNWTGSLEMDCWGHLHIHIAPFLGEMAELSGNVRENRTTQVSTVLLHTAQTAALSTPRRTEP